MRFKRLRRFKRLGKDCWRRCVGFIRGGCWIALSVFLGKMWGRRQSTLNWKQFWRSMEVGLEISRIFWFKHLTFIYQITLLASKMNQKPLHSSPPWTSSRTSSFALRNSTSTKIKNKNYESCSLKLTWDFQPVHTSLSLKVTSNRYRLKFVF